jgi:hypothetical protein
LSVVVVVVVVLLPLVRDRRLLVAVVEREAMRRSALPRHSPV